MAFPLAPREKARFVSRRQTAYERWGEPIASSQARPCPNVQGPQVHSSRRIRRFCHRSPLGERPCLIHSFRPKPSPLSPCRSAVERNEPPNARCHCYSTLLGQSRNQRLPTSEGRPYFFSRRAREGTWAALIGHHRVANAVCAIGFFRTAFSLFDGESEEADALFAPQPSWKTLQAVHMQADRLA